MNSTLPVGDLHMLVGKILTDEAFAQQLVDNPDAALELVGIQVTPEVLEVLQGLDMAAIRELSEAFGQGKAAN